MKQDLLETNSTADKLVLCYVLLYVSVIYLGQIFFFNFHLELIYQRIYQSNIWENLSKFQKYFITITNATIM